tara:strand:+ start:88 stop:483 length:396 start_codon:yes stop_codon:yes gene_type:complete
MGRFRSTGKQEVVDGKIVRSRILVPFTEEEEVEADAKAKAWAETGLPKKQWGVIRSKRNGLLKLTDFSQMPDVAPAIKEKYAAYRQALRDLPQDNDDPQLVMDSLAKLKGGEISEANKDNPDLDGIWPVEP